VARDLRLFYLFRLLATSYLWVPVSVLFPQSRGLGFDEVMLLSAIYSVVVILIEVPTGALADRIGRRQSMLFGALAMVFSGISAYFAHSFSAFAVATVLAAVSMALCSGADSAYLFDLLHAHGRSHEYPQREGTASAWHQVGLAMACLAGGLLGEIDLALPYLVTAGVSAASVVVALCMRPERHTSTGESSAGDEMRGYLSHMGRSLRDVASSRVLAWVIGYSAVVFVLVRSTEYLYQPYLDERGFSVSEIGFIFAVLYALASFMSHHVDRLRRLLGEETLVYGLLLLLSTSFLLLESMHGDWAPLVMLAVQAVAVGLYSPLAKTLLNRQITDSSRRATILSVESIARRAAKGLFSPVAGYVGAASAMYLCGSIGLIGLVILAAFAGRMVPTLGRLQDAPPAAGDDGQVHAVGTSGSDRAA
jgi:MFS family permease